MHVTEKQGRNTLQDTVNWTKLFWIDVLLHKNKTSHKDP